MKIQSILNGTDRIRTIAYWMFTIPVAFENAAGAIWVLLRLEYPRLVLAHLGYPQYIQYILGPWEPRTKSSWAIIFRYPTCRCRFDRRGSPDRLAWRSCHTLAQMIVAAVYVLALYYLLQPITVDRRHQPTIGFTRHVSGGGVQVILY